MAHLLTLSMPSKDNATFYSVMPSDIFVTYKYILTLNDKRVADWFLMEDPVPSICVATAYLAFCIIAPRSLQGRSFNIDKYVRVYNLAMVIVSFYILYELCVSTIGYYYWPCEPMDYSMNTRPMRIASALWVYYLSKFFELLDSVFFILRGKYNQLTFLHVYHHSSMVLLGWVNVNFVPGGNTVVGTLLNCGIHIIMYSYYFFASLGPAFKRYLWWKKYLTTLQIIQFLTFLGLLIHIELNPECDWPMSLTHIWMLHMTSFLFLFMNFFYKTYKTTTTTPLKMKKES